MKIEREGKKRHTTASSYILPPMPIKKEQMAKPK
jgi:hypothetical protein